MDGDEEQAVFNMVNSLLMRVHQSGHLAQITDNEYRLVKEGLDFYKKIREDIPASVPFWPIGLPAFKDPWVSFGLRTENNTYLAVWRLDTVEERRTLSIPHLQGADVEIRLGYPTGKPCSWHWKQQEGMLEVSLPASYTARILILEKKSR